MLHGYKRLRDVWADKSLSKLVVREVFPGSDVVSDEDLWRAIQNSATTFHHPVSELGFIAGAGCLLALQTTQNLLFTCNFR